MDRVVFNVLKENNRKEQIRNFIGLFLNFY